MRRSNRTVASRGVVLACALAVGCAAASSDGDTTGGDGEAASTAGSDSGGSGGITSTTQGPSTTSDGSGTGEDVDAADDTGPGDPDLLVGSFQLQLSAPHAETAGTTTLFGKVFDGATPDTLVWELGTTTGDCHLSTPRVPYCTEPCGGAAACVEDETCAPYPSPVGAGEVTVTGLATQDGDGFVMTPIAGNYQPPAGTTLAYPGFAEGDAITLSAAGDEVGGFELAGVGVAPLVLTNDEFALDGANDLALAWTPAGPSADSVVHVKLDISHHGGTKGMIECDAADEGALVIDAGLVAELLDLGVAGFPTIIVTRQSTSSTVTSLGRVDLVISSADERDVVIDGVVSCTDDSECTDGQTCQPDLTCQ